MATVTFNGTVIADSNEIESMSGYTYVPHEAIVAKYFEKTATSTSCPAKGTASYYTISVDGEKRVDACWYYPKVTQAGAAKIENWVGFYEKDGVKIVKK